MVLRLDDWEKIVFPMLLLLLLLPTLLLLLLLLTTIIKFMCWEGISFERKKCTFFFKLRTLGVKGGMKITENTSRLR